MFCFIDIIYIYSFFFSFFVSPFVHFALVLLGLMFSFSMFCCNCTVRKFFFIIKSTSIPTIDAFYLCHISIILSNFYTSITCVKFQESLKFLETLSTTNIDQSLRWKNRFFLDTRIEPNNLFTKKSIVIPIFYIFYFICKYTNLCYASQFNYNIIACLLMKIILKYIFYKNQCKRYKQ